jgi:hypothetical protein
MVALSLLGLVLCLAAWPCVIGFALHVPPPWRWWAIGYAAALVLLVVFGCLFWRDPKEAGRGLRQDYALAASLLLPFPMIPAMIASGRPWGLVGGCGFVCWIVSELISRVIRSSILRSVRNRTAPDPPPP